MLSCASGSGYTGVRLETTTARDHATQIHVRTLGDMSEKLHQPRNIDFCCTSFADTPGKECEYEGVKTPALTLVKRWEGLLYAPVLDTLDS